MKNIVVTGAAGFIGSHLTETLVKMGMKVKAYVHYNSNGNTGNLRFLPAEIQNEVEIVFGNIEDPFSVEKLIQGADTVLHLAALIAIPYSYTAPGSYVSTNISGTLNVLEACKKYDVSKMVHTSTSETYGTAQYTPIDEKHPMQGQSPYSASKIGADKIAESYYRSFSLPVATIRPFNTYGPRQSARAVIPTIISQLLQNTDKQLKLGALTPVRDFNFVSDTVNGFIRIAENEKSVGEVINIGSGKGITIGETAQKLIEMIDPEFEIKLDSIRKRPEKSEVFELLCDNTKARELLGWKPLTSLDEGLKQSIEYIRNHPDFINSTIYNI